MLKLLPFLIVLFAFPAFAQSDLPKIGTLADIKGMTKVYVAGDTSDRMQIIKALKKIPAYTIENDPDAAELFIEYKTISTSKVATANLATGQIDVYFRKDGRKVIAWSGGGTWGAYGGATAAKIAGRLVKDLQTTK